MNSDLEARVVQAARDVITKMREAEPARGAGDDVDLRVLYAILGARAALAEIERDVGWREVSAFPPGTDFLAYDEGDGSMYRCRANEDDYFEAVCGQPVVVPPEPTHGMLLPPAPTSHPQSADQTKRA